MTTSTIRYVTYAIVMMLLIIMFIAAASSSEPTPFPESEADRALNKANRAIQAKRLREAKEREDRHNLIDELKVDIKQMNACLYQLDPSLAVSMPVDLTSSTDELIKLMDVKIKVNDNLNKASDDEFGKSPQKYDDDFFLAKPSEMQATCNEDLTKAVEAVPQTNTNTSNNTSPNKKS